MSCRLFFALAIFVPLSAQAQTLVPTSMEQEAHDLRRSEEINRSAGLSGRALIEEIHDWLCTQFELPRLQRYPRIEPAPVTKIASLRQASLRKGATGLLVDGERETVAIYDDASQTIYLPESWAGDTEVEQSVLVHEMVHHFQNVHGMRYECAQAREKLAYVAQERWLTRSGRSLETDFQLDPFTLLVSTTCPYLN